MQAVNEAMTFNPATPRIKTSEAKERLRRSYRPKRVRILFVGEGPPASGRFFYRADSGLYRAIRDAFVQAFQSIRNETFLESFRELGCYLVDLCGMPVDRLRDSARRRARIAGEPRLGETLRQLQPTVVITVAKSVAQNVERAEKLANWSGVSVTLPYPGRWLHHRAIFLKGLIPVLRKFGPPPGKLPG
jgi:hypothetical protein